MGSFDRLELTYRSFASVSVFKRIVVEPLILGIIALCSLFAGQWETFSVSFLFTILSLLGAQGMNLNACCRFEMSESGLSNHFLNLAWGDIESYGLCRVFVVGTRSISFRRRDLPSFVCFGEYLEGDFRDQSPEKSVFFEMTPKNMKMLAQFGKGKSDVVDDFLEKYYDVICKDK